MNWSLRFLGIVMLLMSIDYLGLAGDYYTYKRIEEATPTTYRMADTIKLEHSGKTALCPDGDAIVLKVSEQPGSSYVWYWNGVPINGLNTNSQTVSQPGSYYARIRNTATNVETVTNTVTLTTATNPIATLRLANPGSKLCERDSLLLTAEGGTTYQWYLNGIILTNATRPTFFAKQAGQYTVRVTDANGCKATSDPLAITMQARPKPVIDSIPPVCGLNASIINVQGRPAGGVFSGPGINGLVFDPGTVAFGNHTINYESPAGDGCAGDKAQRTILVTEPPTVQLPSEIVTSNLRIVSLEPAVAGNGPFSYRWEPTSWLNNIAHNVVAVTFPQHDTTYTVHVKDRFGCMGSASIRIIVKAKVNIPDAFTPNGDQINDTWKLPGIESFPQAQVIIYSRWGEVVFRSHNGYLTPFDGRLNGEPLPAGVYLYVLKLSPDDKPLNGTVVIAR